MSLVTAAKTTNAEQDATRSTNQEQWWLTRVFFLRFLGLLYCNAFLIALHQNGELLGDDALYPATTYMSKLGDHVRRTTSDGSSTLVASMSAFPSLFWLYPPTSQALAAVATAGLGMSLLLVWRGAANTIVMLSLWFLYMSIVNVGATFYSFAWESLLLETGFLSAWLVPWWSLNRFEPGAPPPLAVVLGCRWLMFRIMLGAGLIKMRGDQCWRDLTCMDTHYQTQPVPNPLSPYLHALPASYHRVEVLLNHLVELVLPFLLLCPSRLRRLRMTGAAAMVLFQAVLICSGNLSFLNWLTILPCVFCFDDASPLVRLCFGPDAREAARRASRLCRASFQGPYASRSRRLQYRLWRVRGTLLLALIAYLSVPVVRNLLSPSQAMNSSYDSLKIVNSYGAFGSVTKQRHEVVLQGTRDELPPPGGRKAPPNGGENDINSSTTPHWLEYEFKCKPGNLDRRPCVITPYHYRLDWLLWFAAFQNYQMNPWLVNFAMKLLDPDPHVRRRFASLLAHDPFTTDNDDDDDNNTSIGDDQSTTIAEDGTGEEGGSNRSGSGVVGGGKGPPKYIRAVLYRYEYNRPRGGRDDRGRGRGEEAAAAAAAAAVGDTAGNEPWEEGSWWRRQRVREYFPPLSIGNPSVHDFLKQHGLLTVLAAGGDTAAVGDAAAAPSRREV